MYVPSYEFLSQKWNQEDRDAFDKKLRESAEARAAKIFANQEADRTANLGLAKGMLDGFGDEGVAPSDWRGKLGVQPQGKAPVAPMPTQSGGPTMAPMPMVGLKPPGAGASAEGDEGEAQARVPLPNAGLAPPSAPQAAPVPPAPSQKLAALSAEERMLKMQLQAAAQGSGSADIGKLKDAYIDLQKRKTAMAVIDHMDNADETERKRLAEFITNDGTNTVKAKYDPKTGFTTLEIDGKPKQMSWNALKRYIVGKATENIDEMYKAMKDDDDRTDKSNKTVGDVAHINNSANSKMLDAATKLEIAGMRKEMAVLRLNAAKSNREIDPKVLQELNELAVKIDETQDPAERARLTGQYKRGMANAMATIGKVYSNVDDRAAKPELSFKDFLDASAGTTIPGTTAGGKPRKFEDLSLPERMDMYRSMQGGRGGTGGGLPVVPPPPPQAGLSVPGRGTSGSHPVVSDGRRPGVDMGIQAKLQDISQRLALPGISDEAKLQLLFERQQLLNHKSSVLSGY